jgi:hypothetical protein
MVRVTDARYVRDYVIWVRFADGVEGEVDLRDELHGEVFLPLKKKKLFRALSVNPDWHTVAWPNGADLAPEFLYSVVTASRTRSSGQSRPQRRSGAKVDRSRGGRVPRDVAAPAKSGGLGSPVAC